jgi:MFS family permease
MSMGLSPILGFVIDRVGKRALFVMISSVISFVSCVYTAFMKTETTQGVQDWAVLAPLIALGFAYSIYASALWGSIPYAVNPKTIGSAFGLTTALQNAGLTLSPFITGFELNAS